MNDKELSVYCKCARLKGFMEGSIENMEKYNLSVEVAVKSLTCCLEKIDEILEEIRENESISSS